MADPISVRVYGVSVLPPSGVKKVKLLRKLDEIERELQHLHTGIKQIRTAALQGDGRSLAGGVMNTRNWFLSLAESYAYIHTLLRPTDGSASGNTGTYYVSNLAQRAFRLGEERGSVDGRT